MAKGEDDAYVDLLSKIDGDNYSTSTPDNLNDKCSLFKFSITVEAETDKSASFSPEMLSDDRFLFDSPVSMKTAHVENNPSPSEAPHDDLFLFVSQPRKLTKRSLLRRKSVCQQILVTLNRKRWWLIYQTSR